MRISPSTLTTAILTTTAYTIILLLLQIDSLIWSNTSESRYVLYLVLLSALFWGMFSHLKIFLKYYYNYKDKSRLIWLNIIFYILHNIFRFINSRGMDLGTDTGFVFMIIFLMVTVIQLSFISAFAFKLPKIAKKSTSIFKAFALLFICIPLVDVTIATFVYFVEDDILKALTLPPAGFPLYPLIALRVLPFILLILSFHRARYKKPKRKNPSRQQAVNHSSTGHSSFQSSH